MARLDVGVWRRAGFRAKAWLVGRSEARYAARFSHSIAVSSADAALLRRTNSSLPVLVVENGVDCARFQPLPEAPSGNDLLFAGVMGYPPNADAVRFFCREILPLVRREVPDARLLIAGQSPPPEVRSLAASEAVLVLPDVADMMPCYRRARLAVVPLRAGGGTPDAIYRHGAGAPFYPRREDLFGEPNPQDAAALLPIWETELRRIVAEHEPSVLLYAPLGVGGHVDHELTCLCC